MSLIAVMLVFMVPLAAACVSRLGMIRCLARRAPNKSETASLALPGCCLDLLWVLAPLLAACAARGYGFAGIAALFFILAACVASLCVVANVIDYYIYLNTRQRFFAMLIPELRPANIRAAATPVQKRQLAALALFLALFPLVCAALFAAGESSARAGQGVFFLCEAAALATLGCLALNFALPQKLRPAVPVPEQYIDSHGIGNHEDIRGQVRGRMLAVRASALGNLLSVILRWRAEKATYGAPEPYTQAEATFLRQTGLGGGTRYAKKSETAQSSVAGGRERPGAAEVTPYRRIILICLESLGQKMLGRYNPRISRGIMPFLHSLLDNYPRLDRMMTANMPTNQGLYALHASRLTYEADLAHSLVRVASLATLLREQGFHSVALSGVTRHYGSKDAFFTRLLGYDEFLAQEDIRRIYPNAPICGWGFADNALFNVAVPILAQHREGRILLQITTADTHPGYYHTMPEESFPEEVRATDSRLFRSLFEADLNLMFFFRALSKAGLYDDSTLVIITGDHSPNHGNEYMRLNDLQVCEPDLVPLVFVTKKPTANPFRFLDPATPCSQLDILPTIIDGLNLRQVGGLAPRNMPGGPDCAGAAAHAAASVHAQDYPATSSILAASSAPSASPSLSASPVISTGGDYTAAILGRSLFVPGPRPVVSKYGGKLRLEWDGGRVDAKLDVSQGDVACHGRGEAGQPERETEALSFTAGVAESALRKWYLNQTAR